MVNRIRRHGIATLVLAILAIPALSQSPERVYQTVDVPWPAVYNAPLGINNKGDVAGFYVDPNGLIHGFTRLSGKFKKVEFPGAPESGCGGINDSGDVVGTYFDIHGFQHGYYLHKGSFTSINVPWAVQTMGIPFELGTGLGTAAYGINNNGDIVGQYADAEGVSHGFRLHKGVFKTIDASQAVAVPGLGTTFYSINNAGDMSGVYLTPDVPVAHGFIRYANHTMAIDFPGSGGSFGTQSNGVNDNGDVVGIYSDPYDLGHGFLLHNGVYSTIDYPGAPFSECHVVNNSGAITGLYYDFSGIAHGFISTIKH